MRKAYKAICIFSIICLTSCGKNRNDTQETPTYKTMVEEVDSITNENETVYPSILEESTESELKLYINDSDIPVIWEDNETIDEIKSELSNGDIHVSMSMYSDNEQVGSLGKSYTTEDKQITTENGDIVLYGGKQIVLFYDSNTWAYTKLGKMDLSEDEVTLLLGNGNVTLRISMQ